MQNGYTKVQKSSLNLTVSIISIRIALNFRDNCSYPLFNSLKNSLQFNLFLKAFLVPKSTLIPAKPAE